MAKENVTDTTTLNLCIHFFDKLTHITTLLISFSLLVHFNLFFKEQCLHFRSTLYSVFKKYSGISVCVDDHHPSVRYENFNKYKIYFLLLNHFQYHKDFVAVSWNAHQNIDCFNYFLSSTRYIIQPIQLLIIIFLLFFLYKLETFSSWTGFRISFKCSKFLLSSWFGWEVLLIKF